MRRITFALLTTCLLCGCGQKGALYIPGEEREAVTPTTDAAATPLSDEEREAAARTNRTN